LSCASLARGGEQALQRLERGGDLDLRALAVGQVEDVHRALAIGGDMGGMDGRAGLEDRLPRPLSKAARSRALTSTTV
jgi:hypothetical protein